MLALQPLLAGVVPFDPAAIVSSGPGTSQPRGVHAADLDGDGDLDVVTASFGDGTVSWHENDGGDPPAFAPHVISSSAPGASSVFVADVNRDGALDVLSASADDNTIAWYENMLPNGFTRHVVAGDALGAASVFATDLDGDGDIDLLSASESDDRIAWYENDGASPPSFTTRNIAIAADGARSVFAADVDGDGDIDVLSASVLDDTVAWYENDGASPPSFSSQVVTTTALGVVRVLAADIDRDGDVDLVSASSGDDTVAWYENDGASPPSFTAHVVTTSASDVRSVHARDVDGDGDIDLLSASAGNDSIVWHDNDGSSPPGFVTRNVASTVSGASDVFAADVNGDGDTDVLSAAGTGDQVAWHDNRTIHRNAKFPEFTGPSELAFSPLVEAVADIDGDGDTDLLFRQSGDVYWYENSGGEAPSFTARIVATSGGYVQRIAAGDMDGDGDPDVLSVANLNPPGWRWYENDGSSPPAFTEHAVPTDFGDWLRTIIAADVDGDGDLDAVVGGHYPSPSGPVVWYENDGSSPPSFTERIIDTTLLVSQVLATDLDRDGDVDILALSHLRRIFWYENDGAQPPSFTTRLLHWFGSNTLCYTMALGDMDGDGDEDVVSSIIVGGTIYWHENDTPHDFTLHVVNTTPEYTKTVFATDLDGDGDLDILISSNTDAWYENDGGSPPAFRRRESDVEGTFSVPFRIAADLNGDGDEDILIGSGFDVYQENRGGQFGLATTDTAPPVTTGTTDLLLVEVSHNGRSGDSDLELTHLDLLFQTGSGSPLGDSEINALIETLQVYLDDGSGSFEPESDLLLEQLDVLELTDGVQSVAFTAGDPAVQVTAGQSSAFFVVVELTADAASQTPNHFAITHLAESGTGAEDASAGIPLQPAFGPNVVTGLVAGGPSRAGAVPDGGPRPGTPLRLGRGADGNVTLSWGASCLTTDDDYGIYEGSFGDFTSHVPRTCSTGGRASFELRPAENSSFFLVVPNIPFTEGSYGLSSQLTERPPSAAACRLLQRLQNCP